MTKFKERRISTAYGDLVVYRDRAGELRWRIHAKNGAKIACASEGYKTMRALKRSLRIALDVLTRGWWQP